MAKESLHAEAWLGAFPDGNDQVPVESSRAEGPRGESALTLSSEPVRGFPALGHDLGETRESEARYRGLLEAAPDAMVVVNAVGEIALLNVQAEKQFGYRRDELVGQKVTNIIPDGFAERLVADGARSAADALAQQIGTGIELVGRRRDGSEFPIEIMLSPLSSSEGILVTAAIRDISVRKAAEKHLAQMEGRYRGLLEAAPDAMVVVNAGGEIVLLNVQAEKQFGYRRDELLGQKVTNIIPEGFAERLIADGARSAADALAQQIGTGIELVGRRREGSEFPIEIMLSPLESAEGILVTAAIRNISERKHMEEQLRQSQKVEAIGRLAGGIAHDFNNILGVILGYGELARAGAGAGDIRFARRLAEMMAAAQRAASLTRQLQAFSRKQILQPKLLDLNDLVASAHKMLGRLIGADLALVVRQAPELGTVRADPGQIDQILLNLAINARDAMPTGGTLTLETSNVELDENYVAEHWPVAPGRYVMLAVSDTGIGMDAETQRQIFEPFFTTKPVGQGTGLGLSTVYGIVKQSDGHIWVYSEPGLGTTFKIYFPRVDAPPDVTRPSAPVEVARGGHETILLVEDSPALREVIRHRLEAGGYVVLLAGDGEEALALAAARSAPIDLLLTDVVMPKLGGADLAKRLTSLRPGLPVLFMSGYTDGVIERSGLLTDRVVLIEKPFKGEALVRLVREVLDRPPSG